MKMEIVRMRARRIVRRSPGVAVRNFVSAFINRDQFIAFMLAWIAALFLAPRLDEAGLISLGEGWIASFEAFVVVAAIWAVWCLASAPFWAWWQDRHRFIITGNRFVYREPFLVATFRCKPTGNPEMYKFKFKDVEPGAFVYCRIELNGAAHLAGVGISGRMLTGVLPHLAERRWGFSLPKSREAIFQIQLPLNAVATTARIYCDDFIVGKHDDQDGTTGNYQFPVRSASKADGAGRSP